LTNPEEVLRGIGNVYADSGSGKSLGLIGLNGIVLDNGNLKISETKAIGLGLVQIGILCHDIGVPQFKDRGHGDSWNKRHGFRGNKAINNGSTWVRRVKRTPCYRPQAGSIIRASIS
jgi:hypothetical protein